MCGLEPKQEAFSKAVFCWLRVRLLVYVEWATFVCSQVKYKNGTDSCSAIDAIWGRLALSEQTRPTGQPAMCMPVSLPECSEWYWGDVRKETSFKWRWNCLPGPTLLLSVLWALGNTACWECSRQIDEARPRGFLQIFLYLLSQDPKKKEKRELTELEIFKPI